MRRHIYILFLVFFLIYYFGLEVYPQTKHLRFEHITVDNGLSENAITSIIQDKQGFLWFGSHDGLNRYDGYEFQTYYNDPKNNLTISSNLIQCLFVDSYGILWIGTFDRGLDRFDPKKNIFIHYINDPKNQNSISDNDITAIHEDDNRILWIGTASGILNKFERQNNKFQHFKINQTHSEIKKSKRIKVIYEDKKGVLWIGTRNGFYSFDREKKCFIDFNYNNRKLDESSDYILSIVEDSFGYLWIMSNNRLIRYDGKRASIINYKKNLSDSPTFSGNETSKLFIDKDGLFWIGIWGYGLKTFNPKTNVFSHYNHDPHKSDSLNHSKITDIFEDRSGIIWIGTEGGGLNKYDKRKTVFENYKNEPLNKNSLSQNNIKRIYEDSSGILWIGTDGKGLNRFDKKKNKFELFLNDPNDPKSISSNYIRSIFEDSFGVLWIGTESGLNKYDENTKSFIHYIHEPNNKDSIPGNNVPDIIEDSKGILWFALEFGGVAGLSRFDRRKNIFYNYYHDPNNPFSINTKNLITIYEDKNKTIWCGGPNGLNRYNREKKTFTNYIFNPEKKSGLSHSWVWSIFEDKKGRLWIGTYGGGLNLLDRKKDSFIHYTDKDGLANNVVYGILDDREGNLWMSTNKGISKFNPKTKVFKNYNREDGLQGNEFNTGSYCKGKDGMLYFGGTNGLTAFYPKNVKDNPHIPSVIITSFKVFNKEFNLPEQISETKKIALRYDQNFISFEFTSLDYSIPSKNKYAYKLEGVDKEWIFRDAKRRFANFTDLSPGNYVFKVRGSNNDGIWNTKGVSLEINISPPFWKTWWFTAFWIVLIILILFFIIKFTYRYIILLKEKSHADKFAVIGKYASFLAHDIKSPLEGTYLIVNELKKMLPENDEKQEYIDDVIGGITQIRSVINGSLDFTKVNNPKFEQLNLNKIIEEFCFEFKKLKNCTFNLKLPNKTLMVFIDHSLIRRVFFNLFQNSFQARKKHCKIQIKTEIKKSKTLIYISDDGKGISKELISDIFEPFSSNKDDGHGIGLAFVSEVIKNHNGNIRVESELGKGTTFIISLPILKNQEST